MHTDKTITAPMTRGGVIHNWAISERGTPFVLCGTRQRTGRGCSQKGRPVYPIDQHQATCVKCLAASTVPGPDGVDHA